MAQLIRNLEVLNRARHRAVTIGNFDGVHAGHQHILRQTTAVAKANGWIPAVLTFDPHPTRVLAPERAPRLLSTLEQRAAWMEDLGIEEVVVLAFNQELASLTPDQFFVDVIVHGLGVKAVLVGENFRFGHRQSGNVATLSSLAAAWGVLTRIVSGVVLRGALVSSSRIRELVEAGRLSMACRLLGRPFELHGRVATGHGIGRRQTVPTLNLDSDSELLPAHGVYVTRTHEQGSQRVWDSITNVGMRPTFNGDSLTVETYLLSPFDGRDPETIRIAFLRRVREERKFDSPDSLKLQILRDVERARTYFRRQRLAMSAARNAISTGMRSLS